jgi:hypothetical protein
LVMFASVIATPTPTLAVPPPVAAPSAVDDASAAPLESSDTRPPLVIAPVGPTTARAPAFATVIAMAAATLTEPELVDALGVAPAALESLPPLVDAVLFAKLRSPATCESTLPPAESGAPFAPAVALEFVVDELVALKLIGPEALSERAVVAVALCSARVSASARPIDVEPVAAPSAIVVALAFVVAEALIDSNDVPGPAARLALLFTFEIATAIAGATDTPAPVAPAFAVVVITCVVLAVNVVADAPVSTPPTPTPADASSSTRFSATDAPIPRLDPPTSVFGSAFAAEVEFEIALMLTAPPFAFSEPSTTIATVSTFAMLRASDPATPTDPPPAPLLASASKLPAAEVVADNVAPAELAAPEIEASLRTLT